MTHSYAEIGPRPAMEWIQAHRGPEMVDRHIWLSRPQPSPATPFPTQSETRVEFKGTVDKCDSCAKVFSEVAKHLGNEAEDAGVATGNPKSPTSQIDALTTVCIRVVCPASVMECPVAKRSCSEGGSVTQIALNRLTEKVQCLEVAFFLPFSGTDRRES